MPGLESSPNFGAFFCPNYRRYARTSARRVGSERPPHHRSIALHARTLHVEVKPAQAAELLATTCTPRTTVNSGRQYCPGSERLTERLLAAEPDPAVPWRDAEHEALDELAVVAVGARDEAAAAAVAQLDRRVCGSGIRHDRRARPEHLELVHDRRVALLRAQQRRRDEVALVRRGLRAAEQRLADRLQLLHTGPHVAQLLAARD